MKNFPLPVLVVFAALVVAFSSGAARAKDIVIAQVAPFGGPLAVSGRDFNLGALIAFDEINAAGGVLGNRLRLVSRDDGYRSADTVRHVAGLIDNEKPLALIGMWGAENIDAVISNKLLENAGMPVIGVRSGVAAFRDNASLFHVRASYRDEVHSNHWLQQSCGRLRR
jgi:branched-chain amino acid transport system substrate-binding protein